MREKSKKNVPHSMKYASFPLFLLFILVGTLYYADNAAADEIRDPYKHFFTESFGDFPEELSIAKNDGKKGIVLFFEMDHCPYCKAMKENILNRRRVQDFYNEHFNIISVDTRGSVEIIDFDNNEISQKSFSQKMGARFTPTIAFIDLNGKIVQKKIGAVNSIERFIQLGQHVLDNRL